MRIEWICTNKCRQWKGVCVVCWNQHYVNKIWSCLEWLLWWEQAAFVHTNTHTNCMPCKPHRRINANIIQPDHTATCHRPMNAGISKSVERIPTILTKQCACGGSWVLHVVCHTMLCLMWPRMNDASVGFLVSECDECVVVVVVHNTIHAYRWARAPPFGCLVCVSRVIVVQCANQQNMFFRVIYYYMYKYADDIWVRVVFSVVTTLLLRRMLMNFIFLFFRWDFHRFLSLRWKRQCSRNVATNT